MKQTFYIDGITCMSCVGALTEFYTQFQGVQSVAIDKETGRVALETDRLFSTTELSANLAAKYSFRANVVQSNNSASEVKAASKWKQLFPLFLIGGYLFAYSGFRWYMADIETAMLDFMGLFFLVFSFFKFLDYRGFAPSFSMYDPIAKAVPFYAKTYPFIELVMGTLFVVRALVPTLVPVLLYITLVILGATTVGVVRSLLDKKAIQCACLGTSLKLPMTEATFIENAVMLAMTVYMLA
jgi:copper chaperone CopZ